MSSTAAIALKKKLIFNVFLKILNVLSWCLTSCKSIKNYNEGPTDYATLIHVWSLIDFTSVSHQSLLEF